MSVMPDEVVKEIRRFAIYPGHPAERAADTIERLTAALREIANGDCLRNGEASRERASRALSDNQNQKGKG